MKPTSIALGLALAAGAAMSTPAAAKAQQPAASEQKAETKIQPSKGAIKAIIELQTAVNANDTASIPAKLAAAQAVAKTPDDRYAIAGLQYKAAVAANNNASKAAALEALIASGKVSPTELSSFNMELGNTYKALNQADRAAAAFERALAANPANPDAAIILAEARASQGRDAEAVSLIQKAIAEKAASGAKADESWYKRAVALAYKGKLPSTADIARQWLIAYPSPTTWHDVIAIYRNAGSNNDSMRLDILRLQRAAGALSSQGDFHDYAYLASKEGYPAEGKAVLEEGFAAGKIDRNTKLFKDAMAELSAKAAKDKAALAGAYDAGLKASTARAARANGDLLAGTGEFAKAAEVYRAALSKSGADANTINLHLGAALAQQGDKAGATAALNAVTGPQAAIAKLWLAYLATHQA